MRKISSTQTIILSSCFWGATVGAFATEAAAQTSTTSDASSPSIIVPTQSSVLNQNSVSLPNTPSVNGSDIIRGAGGVSCQTAIASGGPHLDLGVIGSEDVHDRGTAALYGRIVVPLGKRAKRVDCSRLYELEIQRMAMELEMLRMGAMMMAPSNGDTPPQTLVDAAEAAEPPPIAPPANTGVAVGPQVAPQPQPDNPPVPTDTVSLRADPIAKPPKPVVAPPPRPRSAAVAPPPPVPSLVSRPEPVHQHTSSGFHYIQIGAFEARSRANAYRESTRASLPKRFRHALYVATSPKDQIFRLRMGPLTEGEANILCASWGSDCFVGRFSEEISSGRPSG